MPCPPGSIHSFVNFQGSLSAVFNDISNNHRVVEGAPFQINFAPRSTPLSHIENYIQEDPNNTLLYRQTTYTLASTQICQPSSTNSYSILGLQSPPSTIFPDSPYSNRPYSEVPTIIFTYISSSFNGLLSSYTNAVQNGRPLPATPSQPLIMLLIVPIYSGNSSSPNSQYLSQFSSNSIRSTYPSMKDLFKNQQSVGYPACLDFILGESTLSVPTNFYTFPTGIVLNDSTYTQFKSSFVIKPFVIEMLPVVQAYKPDGTPDIKISTNTNIPIISAPIGNTKILGYIQQYTKSPSPSNFVNPNLKPEQYQCYPFNELQNIDPESGTVMNLGEAIKVNDTQNNRVGSMLDWKTIGGLVGGIMAAIAAFLLLIIIFYLLSLIPAREIPATSVASAPSTI